MRLIVGKYGISTPVLVRLSPTCLNFGTAIAVLAVPVPPPLHSVCWCQKYAPKFSHSPINLFNLSLYYVHVDQTALNVL